MFRICVTGVMAAAMLMAAGRAPAAALTVADVTDPKGDGPDGIGNTSDDTWRFWFALAHNKTLFHRLDIHTATMLAQRRAKGIPGKVRGPIGSYLPNPKDTEGWIYHSDWDGRFEGVWGDKKAGAVIMYPYVEKNSHCPVALTYRVPKGGGYDISGKLTDIQVVKHCLHTGILWRIEIVREGEGKTSGKLIRVVGKGGPVGDKVGPDSQAFAFKNVPVRKGELVRLVIDPNKWWGTDMTRVDALKIVRAGDRSDDSGKPAARKDPGATKSVAGLVAAVDAGWPQWRGPRRDGICNETGLLQSWPAGGPRQLWSITGLGQGWSAPIISGGRLYITGDVGGELWIFAYRMDGTLAWKVRNGRAWTGSYPGSRASCTFYKGWLYHMNAHGRVACLDAATGRSMWTVDTFQRFGATQIRWGHSECLLVENNRVIVTPGGRKATMAALDRFTGKTLWTCGPVGKDAANYASPILFEYGGLRHLVSYSSHHAFGVNADTGDLLWTVPRPTRYQVMATPAVYHDASLFLTGPDGKLAEQVRLTVSGRGAKVTPTWTSELNCMTGGAVFLDGRLYGAGYRKGDGWHCVDPATGKTLYSKRDLNSGAVLYADGLLYCFSERGEVALLKPTAKGFETAGRFTRIAKRIKDAWAHPVIHKARLYLRYHDTLWCHDVAAAK